MIKFCGANLENRPVVVEAGDRDVSMQEFTGLKLGGDLKVFFHSPFTVKAATVKHSPLKRQRLFKKGREKYLATLLSMAII